MSKRNVAPPPYHNTVLVKYMCCAHQAFAIFAVSKFASTVNCSKIANASYFADEATEGCGAADVWLGRCTEPAC